MKPMKRILGCLRKADNDYELIQDGDAIAVGISGGKDSSVLLYSLYLYRMFSKKEFTIMGICIDLGFGSSGMNDVVSYFSQYDLKIELIPSQISEILDLNSDEDGCISCSLCSRLRKGALINEAKRLGCNKIALGHHNDDAVETLFMNMIHGGKVATLQPYTELSRSGMIQIRPLIYAYENDISRAAREMEIPIASSGCPNDGNSERQEIKDMLKELYKKYPEAKNNFQLMLHNNEQFDLFKPKKTDSE